MNRFVLPAAALGVVLVTAVGGSVVRPAAAPPPEPVPYTGRVTTVCPHLPDTDQTVALDGGTDATRAGSLSLRRLNGTEITVVRPGGQAKETVDGTTIVRGDGDLARLGGAAVLATGGRSALALAPCVPPSADSWLTGVRSDLDHSPTLVLTNPDDAQVSVDVRVLTSAGEKQIAGLTDVVVEKESSREVPLSALIDEADPVSIQVHASGGRVAATVVEADRRNRLPAGTDLLVPTTAPATEQIIAGIPGGSGTRELVVTNPGQRRTEVRIDALGGDGAYVPSGADAVDVAPRSTAVVTLGEGWDQTQVSLRVRADEPVLAGFRSSSGADLALQPAQEPLSPEPLSPGGQGTAALAPIAATDKQTGTLVLANPTDGSVTVRVGIRTNRRVDTRQVTIRPQSSTVVKLDGGAAAAIVSDPSGAPLRAAIVLTDADDGIAAAGLLVPAAAGSGVQPVADPGLR